MSAVEGPGIGYSLWGWVEGMGGGNGTRERAAGAVGLWGRLTWPVTPRSGVRRF